MATSIADFVPGTAQRVLGGAVDAGRRTGSLVRFLGNMVLFTGPGGARDPARAHAATAPRSRARWVS